VNPINNEEKDLDFSESRDVARLIEKDPDFRFFWNGGKFGPEYHLVLKRQLATIDLGNGKYRLLYNERPYRRPRKGCLPPKFIRMQGRSAHSRSNIANHRPFIRATDKDGKEITLHNCTCGGDLEYDSNEYLYCLSCGLIHNSAPVGYLQYASLIHSRGARDVTYSNWWYEIDDWYDEEYYTKNRDMKS
jgi:hypothetical protein